jgi:hypothetical protein
VGNCPVQKGDSLACLENYLITISAEYSWPESNTAPNGIRRIVKRDRNGIPERVQRNKRKQQQKSGIQGMKYDIFYL